MTQTQASAKPAIPLPARCERPASGRGATTFAAAAVMVFTLTAFLMPRGTRTPTPEQPVVELPMPSSQAALEIPVPAFETRSRSLPSEDRLVSYAATRPRPMLRPRPRPVLRLVPSLRQSMPAATSSAHWNPQCLLCRRDVRGGLGNAGAIEALRTNVSGRNAAYSASNADYIASLRTDVRGGGMGSGSAVVYAAAADVRGSLSNSGAIEALRTRVSPGNAIRPQSPCQNP